MTATDEDEFSELVDAKFPRVDLVGKGANGVPRWLIAKQDAGAGLLPPAYVRDLIAKAEPEPSGREQVTMPNGITVSGSPADIAAFIHGAAVRYEADVAKAEMSAKSINDLPDSYFAYIEPGGKKDESGRTVPRSLRHFPIHDKAHADNAAARIAQGAEFGDKAKAKVEAAQRKFGEKKVSKEAAVADPVSKDMMDAAGDATALDDGIDGMDPTVPLCAPGEMGPGDPTDPGSPAWESIDAATAGKWLSIAARLKNALGVLADREMLEAASADPDDAENAWNLQDAMCAVDFAIEQLAVFAAGEQAQAEICAEMDGIAKTMAGFDPAPLAVIEGLAAVRKSGRVLSSANEAAIRDADQLLQKVLASLPEAPVAKQASQKEGAMPGTRTAGDAPAQTVAKEGAPASPEAQAADTGPVNAGGTTGLGEPRTTGPEGALPGDGQQKQLPGDVPGRTVVKSALALVYNRDGSLAGVTDAAAIVQRVAKADGDGEKKAMQAVFDQDGDLIGIVDPDAIQPVTGAGSKPAADGSEPQAGPAAAADDMTPQPAADAGTPASDVAKSGGTVNDAIILTQDVLKSIVAEGARQALETQEAAHREVIAKMAGEQATEIEALKARVKTVESNPAAPRVFTNGQVPPAHQLRGQDQGGAAHVDVAKAQEMRREFLNADPAEQNRLAGEMQQGAIATLAAIHGR